MGEHQTSRQSEDEAEYHLDLDFDSRAAGSARRTVRTVLERWRLPGLVDSLVLSVSELVTNAVRHGRPPVSLTLRRTPDEVRLDVQDDEPEEPRSAAVGDDAESGRGMAIVSALADETGTEQVTDDGKVVYAAFRTPSD